MLGLLRITVIEFSMSCRYPSGFFTSFLIRLLFSYYIKRLYIIIIILSHLILTSLTSLLPTLLIFSVPVIWNLFIVIVLRFSTYAHKGKEYLFPSWKLSILDNIFKTSWKYNQVFPVFPSTYGHALKLPYYLTTIWTITEKEILLILLLHGIYWQFLNLAKFLREFHFKEITSLAYIKIQSPNLFIRKLPMKALQFWLWMTIARGRKVPKLMLLAIENNEKRICSNRAGYEGVLQAKWGTYSIPRARRLCKPFPAVDRGNWLIWVSFCMFYIGDLKENFF